MTLSWTLLRGTLELWDFDWEFDGKRGLHGAVAEASATAQKSTFSLCNVGSAILTFFPQVGALVQ